MRFQMDVGKSTALKVGGAFKVGGGALKGKKMGVGKNFGSKKRSKMRSKKSKKGKNRAKNIIKRPQDAKNAKKFEKVQKIPPKNLGKNSSALKVGGAKGGGGLKVEKMDVGKVQR